MDNQEYLQHLTEGTLKDASFLRVRKEIVIDKDELMTELAEVFTEEEIRFMNEINVIPADSEAGKMGIQGVADLFGRKVTGIIDMDKLLHYIKVAEEKASASGYSAGETAGQKAGVEAGAMGALGSVAVAALVVTVAFKTYKRFLSKAARACKGKKGDMKTSCMNKFKRDAMKAQLVDLNKGAAGCSKTKNPAKCKAKIGSKMQKIKSKLGTL